MASLHASLSMLDSILASLRHLYRDFQRVRADTADLLRSAPTLAAQRGQCVRPQPPSNTPVVSDLLKIIGTIPIVHYNTKFDVPIEMWIPEAYPYASPVCKIAISQAPPIKPLHLHVDAQGNIYLPYITYWNAVSSNLLGLLGALARTLTDNFPFVLNAPPTPAPVSAPPPRADVSQSAYSATASTGSAMHYYSTPLPFSQPSAPPAPSEDSLPLPFAPAHQTSFPSPPALSAQQHALPSPSVHTPLSASLAAQDYHSQASYAAPPAYASVHPPAPQPPSPQTQQAAQPPPPPEEEPSLMSFQRAYEDPVVLRNNLLKSLTERTQQRLKSFYAATTKEIEELMETNQTLKRKLQDAGNHRLNEALDLATREHQDQQRQLAEVNAWLAAHDKGDKIDVDEVTEPKDPLAKQLIHVIAEDAAYDDAYYQLEQLLASSKIDLQTFLKTSRTIAREQFMCRALIKKITEKLNERAPAARR